MPRLEYDVVFNLDTSSVSTLKDELNEISGGGIKSVNDQTEKANKNFKRLSSSANQFNDSFSPVAGNVSDAADQIERSEQATKGWSKSIASVNQGKFVSVTDASKDLTVSLDRSSNSAEELRTSLSLANSGLERTAQNAGNLRARMDGFGGAVRRAGSSMGGMSKTANNSNQILFSFGDAMQDGAQFSQGFSTGMRAVGNNLTFAAEQIAIANQKTGSIGATFKSLGASMLSPAGMVFAINAAVTAITLWSQSAEKAEKRTSGLTTAVNELSNEYSRSGGFLSQTERAIKKTQRALQESRKIERSYKELANVLGENSSSTSFFASALSGLNEEQQAQVTAIQNRISESKGFIEALGLEETSVGKLTQKLKELRAEQSIFSGEQGTLNTRYKALANTIEGNATQALEQFQVGLDGSRSKLKLNRAELRATIDNFLQLANSGRTALVPVIASMQSELDKINDALSDTNVNLRSANEILNELAETQQFINSLKDPTTSFFGAQAPEIPRAAGGPPEEDPIAREQKRLAEFLNIEESAAKKRFNIEKQLQNSLVKLSKDSEQAQTAITAAQAESRKSRALTAIQSVGSGLTQLFEKQKGVAIAGAIINAGAAIVRQFKDLPIWAAIPSAALTAAKTAKQIQQIQSVEQGDQNAPSIGGGGARSASQGFNTTNFDTNQQPDPSIGRDAAQQSPNIVIEADNILPDTEFSRRAENGKKERITRSKSVNII